MFRANVPGRAVVIEEGQFLWEGSEAFVSGTALRAYQDWLARERGLDLAAYEDLRQWSVADPSAFWQSVWDYFAPIHEGEILSVVDGVMPTARWFGGTRLNYAENILRHAADRPESVALHHLSELRRLETIGWGELAGTVRKLATRLRALGIGKGDRVACYMPNIAETMVAMLAVTAIGGVWSSAAPEFGVRTVLDRFAQVRPKLVFVADGYRFAGRDFDRREAIAEILSGLETVEHIVWLGYLDPQAALPPVERKLVRYGDLLDGPEVPAEAFRFERVENDHPLWILFSSGTTGLPKAIVHNHHGIVVENLKTAAFHLNLGPGSVMYFYSTTGWVMWNALPYALIRGGASVLYDGSPAFPRIDVQWEIAARTGVTSFGTSPTFVQTMEKAGVHPGRDYDLSRLENIFLAGSPATPESFVWLYREVKADLWVTSQSGGTEFASGLVGGVPTLPVHAGEIQAVTLGVDLRVLGEDGEELPPGRTGELVLMAPMPSMPIALLGDDSGARYRESYFEHYPGMWRHGDFIRLNERGGCFIEGRSDATLNRFGVRIGSAEIYRTVDTIPEIADSLIVCIEERGGGFYMPLFVQLREGARLDDELTARIVSTLKRERSPRHVPDEIRVVPLVPYTLSRKKMEVPVRKLLMGWAAERAVSRDSAADPAALDWFIHFAAARRSAASLTHSETTGS